MAMNLTVQGMDQLREKLREIQRRAPDAVIRATYEAGLFIQGKAQDNTPVEYGNLRGSAYTNRTRKGAVVGYTSEYALFVHENMEQKLKGQPRPSGLGTYWNPGGPKFLERAVNENIDGILALVERRLREVLET